MRTSKRKKKRKKATRDKYKEKDKDTQIKRKETVTERKINRITRYGGKEKKDKKRHMYRNKEI